MISLLRSTAAQAAYFAALCLLIFALLFIFAGCKSDYIKKKDVDEQLEKLTKAVDSSWQQKDVAIEEFKKLQQFEYQILRFRLAEMDSIQTRLNELGKERWDCFHVERIEPPVETTTTSSELMIFCKRPPETPLKYVPRNILGLF